MTLVLKREKTQKQNTTKSPQLIQAIGLHEKSELEIERVISEKTQSNIFLEDEPVEVHFDDLLVHRPDTVILEDDFSDENSGWSVKDVGLHLLGVEIGNLAARRDQHKISAAISSWDELVEYSKILTIREGNQTKQYGLIIPGGWNDWIFEAFSRQNGSQLIKEDGLTVTFNTPQNLEALKLWVKLTQELKVCPVLRPWNITPDDFIGGVTAMMYYSTGGMAKIRKTAQFNWGAAFQPAGKQYGTPVGGGDFHIFKGIPKENQDAAWKFAKFMTTPKMAAHWSIESGYVAVNKNSYDLQEMKEFLKQFPQMTVARDQLEYAYPKMMAVNYQLIRNAMTTNLDAAIEGKKTPEEALVDAQKLMEQAIKGQ